MKDKSPLLVLLIGAVLFSFISCKRKVNEVIVLPPVVVEADVKLPEMEAGEVFYKNKNPFGETIQLTGEQVMADTVIFKVSEAKMTVRGNRLLIKNRGAAPFMLFEYPEMKFLGYEGIFGSGPDEFNFPQLVPSADSSLVSYLFEITNQKLYRMDKEGSIKPDPFLLVKSERGSYSDKQLVNVAPNDFIYVESTNKGRSIFRSSQQGDSVVNREVFNLSLNPKRKSWVTYIGDFAVNPQKNRMVFAYKYFKMLKFMDMEAKQIRTVNFEKEEFDDATAYKADGMDQNVTHYWGVCAQDKYVYFLYSGRTPMEVGRDSQKGNHYIYVEQYDWNGNPVRRFKLDHWGYFTVDEASNSILLLSTNDDDPIFIYKMPEDL